MTTDTLAALAERLLAYAGHIERSMDRVRLDDRERTYRVQEVADLRAAAALAAPPLSTDTREKEYVAIANLAQEATGRSVWPSTVQAVLEAADLLARPAAGYREAVLRERLLLVEDVLRAVQFEAGKVKLFAPGALDAAVASVPARQGEEEG